MKTIKAATSERYFGLTKNRIILPTRMSIGIPAKTRNETANASIGVNIYQIPWRKGAVVRI